MLRIWNRRRYQAQTEIFLRRLQVRRNCPLITKPKQNEEVPRSSNFYMLSPNDDDDNNERTVLADVEFPETFFPTISPIMDDVQAIYLQSLTSTGTTETLKDSKDISYDCCSCCSQPRSLHFVCDTCQKDICHTCTKYCSFCKDYSCLHCFSYPVCGPYANNV